MTLGKRNYYSLDDIEKYLNPQRPVPEVNFTKSETFTVFADNFSKSGHAFNRYSGMRVGLVGKQYRGRQIFSQRKANLTMA